MNLPLVYALAALADVLVRFIRGSFQRMKLVLLAAQILYVFGAVHLSAWTVDKLDKLSKEQEANAAAEAEVQAVEAKKAEKERLLAEEKKEGKVRQRGKGKNKRKKKQVEDEREKEKEEARMAQEEEAEKAKRKAQQGTASSVVLRTIGIYCVGSLLLALLFFAHLPKRYLYAWGWACCSCSRSPACAQFVVYTQHTLCRFMRHRKCFVRIFACSGFCVCVCKAVLDCVLHPVFTSSKRCSGLSRARCLVPMSGLRRNGRIKC